MIIDAEENMKKINTHNWVVVEEGIRESTWAKIKQGQVHVISFIYDEDGWKCREVFVGNTYKEAIESDPILSHDEDFEPIDIDGEDW